MKFPHVITRVDAFKGIGLADFVSAVRQVCGDLIGWSRKWPVLCELT